MMDVSKRVNEMLLEAKGMSPKEQEAAKDLCLSALKIARRNELIKEHGEILLQLLKSYRILSMYEEALDAAREARVIFQSTNDDEGLMKLNNMIGILYYYNGIYELAIEHLEYSYHLAEKLNENKYMMAALNNIGEVKKKAGDLDEAYRIYMQSYELAKDNRLTVHYGVIIQNIGDVHMKRGDLKKAEECFREAYSCYIEESDIANLSELSLNLGRLYLAQDDPERARDYFDSAISTLEEVHNKFYILDVLIELYHLDYDDDPNEALAHLKRARKLAEESHVDLKLSEIELLLNKHYEKRGDYERALYHFKRYHNLIQKLDANNLILKLKIMKLENSAQKDLYEKDPVSSIMNNEIEAEREKIKVLEEKNSELTFQAYHDKLTKLPNRRKIDHVFDSIAKNFDDSDSRKNIGLFLIDIDYFKLVNDNMGHLFGDTCLEAIGEALTSLAIKHDGFVGRYGGEEFIFIKEDLDLYLANFIAQDLNDTIRRLGIEYDVDGETKQLTISVGALYCENLIEFKKRKLVDITDKALYLAKAAGRDRSVLHRYKDVEDITLHDQSS